MIPKIIHYCWFGRKPLPTSAQQCMESWKAYLPDYEIKEWNEDNFDIHMIPYTAEAYRLNKFAFVSDYARFWILYHYGGLYFDVDVEIIHPMDDIIERGPFMGLEKMEGSDYHNIAIAPGLGIGTYQHHKVYKQMIDFYRHKHFISWNGKMTGTVVHFMTDILLSQTSIEKDRINLYEGIYIYPDDYFDPMNYYTGNITITTNTRSIHKYSSTWVTKMNLFQRIINRIHYILVRIYISVTFRFFRNVHH